MFTKESRARVSQPEPRIVVRQGLEGQDENIEVLQGYFREMQTMTVETSMDADLDLLTFALGAHYFGVIIKEDHKESKCGTDGRGEARPTDHVASDIAELRVRYRLALKRSIIIQMTMMCHRISQLPSLKNNTYLCLRRRNWIDGWRHSNSKCNTDLTVILTTKTSGNVM